MVPAARWADFFGSFFENLEAKRKHPINLGLGQITCSSRLFACFCLIHITQQRPAQAAGLVGIQGVGGETLKTRNQ
jgi:hypothetical protein